MQCHVLGVALLPIVGVPFLLDCPSTAARAAVPLGWSSRSFVAALPAAGVNELTTGFSEVRAALDYLAGGGGAEAAIPVRFGIVGLRVVELAADRSHHRRVRRRRGGAVGVVAIVVWRWRGAGQPANDRGPLVRPRAALVGRRS